MDCSTNEYSAVNPYLVEYSSCPAKDYKKVRAVLIDQIEKIAARLDLADGIFHVQYKMRNGQIFIIEAMRRCLGNYFLDQASHISNFNWNEWIAKAYCGICCSQIPEDAGMKGYEAEKYIMSRKNGIIKNISVSSELNKYLYDVKMIWKPGQIVENYLEEMLGYLFLEFDTETLRETTSYIISISTSLLSINDELF